MTGSTLAFNGSAMLRNLHKLPLFLLMAAIAAATLSGCGKKGALDLPGTYDTQDTDAAAAKKSDENDNSFVLDPLL